MMVSASFLLLMLPILLVLISIMLVLVLGLRNGGEPSCRACGESIAHFGEPFTSCPSCEVALTSPRAYRFRGRRRPLRLWLVCGGIALPILLLLSSMTAIAFGTVSPRTVQVAFTPPSVITGPITFQQATSLSTDDLLDTLRTNASPFGWMELQNRLNNSAEPNEKDLLKALDVADEALKTPAGDPATVWNEMRWLPMKALEHFGAGNPQVALFLRTHCLKPPQCPDVHAGKDLRLDLSKVRSSVSGGIQFWGRLQTTSILTKIEIDNQLVPERNAEGVRTYSGTVILPTLAKKYLPASALNPGTHELKLEIRSAILPPGVSRTIPPAQWPASTLQSISTITCSYTVEAPQ